MALAGLPPALVLAGLLWVAGWAPSASDEGALPFAQAASSPAVAATAPSPGLLVSVTGAVVSPGLYRLNRGERVFAAIAAAGGLASDADPQRLPAMAARLRDGEQVRVPAQRSGAGQGVPRNASRVPINQATVEELVSVPGFDPELAEAVVARRERYGPFSALKQLQTEVGMGDAAYRLAKPHLSL